MNASQQPTGSPPSRSASTRGLGATVGAPATVLHITQPGSEGVGNYVAAIGRSLADRGHRIAVVGPPDTPLQDALLDSPVVFLAWQSTNQPTEGLVADVNHLRRLIGAVRPDVVHLHSSKAGLAGRLALRRRVPTVFQPHAWSFEALRRPFAAAAASWEAAAAGWTDVVIAVSHREATTGVTRGIRSDRLEIVPNPVDPARFRPADVVDRERPGEVPPATSNRPVVLCVGRICRQKGQDDLLRAWSLVRRAVPDARLVLAGEGPLRTEIARLADDSVQLLGDRSDVADLYRQADLVVIPSRWEGMSLAMLEAMASGVSVVATDVGGVAETVGRGAGTVVPVGDVGRLADAVVKRLNDPALRLAEGATGRRLVLAEHTVDRTADRLSGIYRSLIKPSASAAVTASTSRTVSA